MLRCWDRAVIDLKKDFNIVTFTRTQQLAQILCELNYTSNTYPCIKGTEWLDEFAKLVTEEDPLGIKIATIQKMEVD